MGTQDPEKAFELRLNMARGPSPAVVEVRAMIDEWGQCTAFSFEPVPGADAHKAAIAAMRMGAKMGEQIKRTEAK